MEDEEVRFEEQQTNMSEIEKLIKDMKDAVIGIDNYKDFFDKVKNSDQVIISQIQNLAREYKRYEAKYVKEKDFASYKDLEEQGFIKVSVFDLTRNMNSLMKQAYNWKTLQEELYSIVFDKMYKVLNDVKALEIKRDALLEMKDMTKAQSEMYLSSFQTMLDFTKEDVNMRLQNFNDKFLKLIEILDRENRKDRINSNQFIDSIAGRLGIARSKAVGVEEDVPLDEKIKLSKVKKPESKVEEEFKEEDVEVEEKANKNDDIDEEFSSFD